MVSNFLQFPSKNNFALIAIYHQGFTGFYVDLLDLHGLTCILHRWIGYALCIYGSRGFLWIYVDLHGLTTITTRSRFKIFITVFFLYLLNLDLIASLR